MIMCKHESLISRNTGELIDSEELTAEDLKDNSYICNICKSLFEFRNGILVKELKTKSAS